MKCGRCGADTSVRTHTVDGFCGYLCDDCLDVWLRHVEAAKTA